MSFFTSLRFASVVFCAASISLAAGAAYAQSGGAPNKPPEQQKSAAEAAKEGQKKIDEIAEATHILTGAAGNPECVWLGRRAVGRMLNDDLDAAFRHMDLYDRFGCPAAHIQATFRCMIRQGNIDLKAQETLNGRVHACWLNPGLPPPPSTAQAPQAESGGTTPR